MKTPNAEWGFLMMANINVAVRLGVGLGTQREISMTEQMKVFLLAFAELLEAHDVDMIEAVDDGAEFYPSVDGVEFNMRRRYNAEGDEMRDSCTVRIGKAFNAKDVRQLVANA